MWVRIRGSVQEDTYQHDLVINIYDIQVVEHQSRQDTAPEDDKRVELHVHSNMSAMDATNNIGDLVKQASKWGHRAIAVTDTTGVQAFPDAFAAAKKMTLKCSMGLKLI